tara:strand:+ start:9629 stop:10738 length:1110 start_codon:yes stop_codon:yes gene_type:complete
MKKISFILPSFEVGGIESNFISAANYLKSSEFEPELVYWFEGGELKKKIDPGVIVTKLKVSSLFSLLIKLIYHYNKSRPAIVQTSMYMIGNIAMIAKIFSFHKPKIIIGAHSNFHSTCKASENLVDEFILRKLSSIFYKRADKIVAVSEGVKNGLIKSLNLEESKIKVIYNGVISKKHREKKFVTPKHSWFSLKNICLVCSIGRLSPVKGIYELVCAFRRAHKLNDNLRLIIIGEGEEAVRIEKYLNTHSMNEYVEIIGFRENYYSYLDNSDIYVLNSYYEGMSNILAEALTTDTKIISTNCEHGPIELLKDVKESKLIDVNNENQLVNAIYDFSKTKKIKRENVPHLKNFYFNESMNKYSNVYIELLS